MRKLLRAGCLFTLAMVAGCQGDTGSTQTSTSTQESASTAQPLTLTTSTVGLVEQATPNGVAVQLDERFQSAIVARRNADGTISTGCHDEQADAEAFLQGAVATQTGAQ